MNAHKHLIKKLINQLINLRNGTSSQLINMSEKLQTKWQPIIPPYTSPAKGHRGKTLSTCLQSTM